MPDYWLDTNSLIKPYREYYSFDKVPKFWDFIKEKAQEQIVVSSTLVLDELKKGNTKDPDELCLWALPLQGILFLSPDSDVQSALKSVTDYINNNKKYDPQWVQDFLSGADPWLIAHAIAQGGKIVTFEELPGQNSKKVKIPEVADHFKVCCVNLFKMLSDLKAKF